MAVCESIKSAMRALETECALAQCQAQSLMLASGDDNSPAWVDMHHAAITRLVTAADHLVSAINGSDQ